MCYGCSGGVGTYARASPSYAQRSFGYQEQSTYRASPLEQVLSPMYQGNSVSALEARIQNHASASTIPMREYSSSQFNYAQSLESYLTPRQTTNYQHVDQFLIPYRPQTQFIAQAAEVETYVREAFALMTGEELPKDILISVVPKHELKRLHELNSGGAWSEGIQGFALNNRSGKGIKQIFVKENDLDRLMLVLGHELGHAFTPLLGNAHDEEAKAFAFERAWMKILVKHNIANLKHNIRLDARPAENGLHNVAYAFVERLLKEGHDAFELYWLLVERRLSILVSLNSD